jgi:hypothetical protein
VAVKELSLRQHRDRLGLRLEEVSARLNPPMSWRTLHRWEKNGIPSRRDENRDAWLEQLAALYKVDPASLNGKVA